MDPKRRKQIIEELSKDVSDLIDTHGLQVLDFCWLKQNGGELAYRLGGYGIKVEEIADALNLRGAMDKFEKDKLLAGWKAMVDEHGLDVYKQRWLQDNKLTQLLSRSKRRGLRLIDIARELGDDRRLAEHRATIPSNGNIRWSAKKFDEIARQIIDKFGSLPSVEFLRQNGYGGFVWQLTVYGPVEDVRKRYGVQNVKLCDIDGNVYMSLVEVCFANYMLARGAKIEQGGLYPEEYARMYGRAWGKYDFHFFATTGDYAAKRISVEIFGGGLACAAQNSKERYFETKKFKLDFHKNDPMFLAIEFKDCYTDSSLTKILQPYIGNPPVVRSHPLVRSCPTTQISQADIILEECKAISQRMSDGLFPSTQWFQRTGSHTNRQQYDWEPSRWAGFLVRLRRVGMAKVREALGQKQIKPVKWTRERFLDGVAAIVQAGYATPSQAKFETEKKLFNQNRSAIRRKLNECSNLAAIWYKMTDLSQTPRNAMLLCAVRNNYLREDLQKLDSRKALGTSIFKEH